MNNEYYEISKIDEKVYLSGALKNYNKLKELGIKYVVNCRSESHDDISILSDMGIGYFYIPIADSRCGRFDQMVTTIKLLRKFDGNFLIHCAQGRGRSVLLTCAYLMSKYNIKGLKSLDIIKKHREFIAPTKEQIDKILKFGERINEFI